VIAGRRLPVAVPLLGLALVVPTWGRTLPGWAIAFAAVVLAGCVLAAVHHAEVVAHRVGEPFGSLVLAVAVTVIEVALIVTLMISGGEGKETLARDTVFAAVMITCNGIVGLCLLLGALRHRIVDFHAEGSGAALSAVAVLATLSLVLPSYTRSTSGPTLTSWQLGFAAMASAAMYMVYVFVQTVRHRDYFLPVGAGRDEPERHAAPPTTREAATSMALLLAALVGVVGLAKAVSPAIERAVLAASAPLAFVGVVIALLVLLPETLAAVRAARHNRVQTSLNLAFGSALASIGLTIPTLAIATIWLDSPLVLGLGQTQIVLLVLTMLVGILTVVQGRATVLQGSVHLVVFGAFMLTALIP
jgi:Ca2+:H+ antiporter